MLPHPYFRYLIEFAGEGVPALCRYLWAFRGPSISLDLKYDQKNQIRCSGVVNESVEFKYCRSNLDNLNNVEQTCIHKTKVNKKLPRTATLYALLS